MNISHTSECDGLGHHGQVHIGKSLNDCGITLNIKQATLVDLYFFLCHQEYDDDNIVYDLGTMTEKVMSEWSKYLKTKPV